MTGVIHEFDARVGGGYRISLFYPPGGPLVRGKTNPLEDLVHVRFIELAPPHKIVEAVSFATADSALRGEMILTVTFEERAGRTEITLLFENLPSGLRPEDNETGARLSLAQLARRFE